MFIRVIAPKGFEVDLWWRVTKVGGNKASALSLLEQKDHDKIKDNQNGFFWTLVQDRDEVEKYWLSAVLSNADPPAAVSVGPEFQIGEPNWAGFSFASFFYTLNDLFY